MRVIRERQLSDYRVAGALRDRYLSNRHLLISCNNENSCNILGKHRPRISGCPAIAPSRPRCDRSSLMLRIGSREGGGRLVFAEEKGKHEGERDVDFRVVLERECLKTSFKYEERCYWMFVTYFR